MNATVLNEGRILDEKKKLYALLYGRQGDLDSIIHFTKLLNGLKLMWKKCGSFLRKLRDYASIVLWKCFLSAQFCVCEGDIN